MRCMQEAHQCAGRVIDADLKASGAMVPGLE
jgi:hypothetical protein